MTGHAFFTEQTYTGVAYDAATGELVGLYILHPNNVGTLRTHLQRKLRRQKDRARTAYR